MILNKDTEHVYTGILIMIIFNRNLNICQRNPDILESL